MSCGVLVWKLKARLYLGSTKTEEVSRAKTSISVRVGSGSCRFRVGAGLPEGRGLRGVFVPAYQRTRDGVQFQWRQRFYLHQPEQLGWASGRLRGIPQECPRY